MTTTTPNPARKQAKAKAPATTKPATPKAATGRFTPTDVVTVLAASNPKKPGSKAHGRFALYATGQTVAAAIAKGVTVADVEWDTKRRFIAIEPAPKAE